MEQYVGEAQERPEFKEVNTVQEHPERTDVDRATADGVWPGILTVLDRHGPDTILTENALAAEFGRHPTAIKRAIERGELPPSERLIGSPYWTVGILRQHLTQRLIDAAERAAREKKRLGKLAA